MSIFKRDNCRLCHSTNLQLVLQLNKSALANAFVADPNIKQDEYPLDLYQCEACGHYQLLDIIDPSIMFKHYLYVSGTSQVMRQHFRNYACSIVSDYNLSSNDFIVDIGSNDGTLLKWFKTLGMRVLGVDPAENLAKQVSEQGIETIPTFFNKEVATQIVNTYGKAAVITANNVFAHSDNLDEIVEGIRILLNEDGIFVFEVSYFRDVVQTLAFDQIYHEHLSFHTISPLVNFFNKHNMAIIRVEHVDVHGGSIRCYVSNYRNSDVSLDALFYSSNEIKYGLFDIKEDWSPVNKFINKIEENKKALKSKLIELKKQGMKIAAVAASAKSTTFLHHYELDANIIDFIADDAKEKQGLYSPGKHILIVPFQAIYEQKPDYLLMLSFNFVDSIIEKHSTFPGKWIVPLPDFKVI